MASHGHDHISPLPPPPRGGRTPPDRVQWPDAASPTPVDELFSMLTQVPARVGPVVAVVAFAGCRWVLPFFFWLVGGMVRLERNQGTPTTQSRGRWHGWHASTVAVGATRRRQRPPLARSSPWPMLASRRHAQKWHVADEHAREPWRGALPHVDKGGMQAHEHQRSDRAVERDELGHGGRVISGRADCEHARWTRQP